MSEIKHQIENSFPEIFKELLEKFPQLDPRRLICAAIKHNFLKKQPGINFPISQMFYVGATAIFEEWSESGESDIVFEEFFQKSFSRISRELHYFLKIEFPEIRRSLLIYYGGEKDADCFPCHENPGEIVENREALDVFFSHLDPINRELFRSYLSGYNAEEIADHFKISNDRVAKVKRMAIKNRFRLAIEKVRGVLGVDKNAPIYLHDHYRRITPDEKREKTAERVRKWRSDKRAKLL